MQTSHIHTAFKLSRPCCLSVQSFSLSVAVMTNVLVFLRLTLCHGEMIEEWLSWCNLLIRKLILEAQLSTDLHFALESRNETLQK